MTETTPRYITIGELWECRECEIEGGHGFFGLAFHDIRHHTLGDSGE